MKYLKIALVAFMALTMQNVKAQTNPNQDTTRRYYTRLANSKDEADKALLRAKLYDLLKSDKEEDWTTARNFFYQLRMAKVSDSVYKATMIKFPMGMNVRNAETDTIYKQTDPVKKEAMYKAWIKKFPPEKFGSERIQYDYVRYSVANAYAEAGNVKKAVAYTNMIETDAWRGNGWGGVAETFWKKGHKKEAEEMYKKARMNAYEYLTTKRDKPMAGFATMGFTGMATKLAEIKFEQKKYDEALKYMREAHDSSKAISGKANAFYAKILSTVGKDQEAFNVIDEAVKAGQATPEMKEILKTLYVKVKGSNAGYDEYLVSMNKIMVDKIRSDLTKQIINQPAPIFTLKDVDGNTVSLADLKGKTVILDFWATWCGPCKRSFPSMKMAMEKFKNDPDVKFLFIHTLEQQPDAADSAKAYVIRNNFPFQVLMDLKDNEGLNPVAKDYKVEGIPTKFVIDKKGNIRFRLLGFSGGEDLAVEEISAMIKMANEPINNSQASSKINQ